MSTRNSPSAESAKLCEWLIYRVGGPRAVHIGTIKALNRETALVLAYDEFDVELADRKRLIALRASDHA